MIPLSTLVALDQQSTIWKEIHSIWLRGWEWALLTANGMEITFEGESEEVDDAEALSFKSMMGLRSYLVISWRGIAMKCGANEGPTNNTRLYFVLGMNPFSWSVSMPIHWTCPLCMSLKYSLFGQIFIYAIYEWTIFSLFIFSEPVRDFFCYDEPPGSHDSLEESKVEPLWFYWL